ncbi:MAG TPA: MBL fold metallo-hydrolase [Candidatus Krumholzibacteriaceae bacterium]|nr:MBL fold metallo-hydrolase [Candidatus Krumholzibacteriaceae bacterium]
MVKILDGVYSVDHSEAKNHSMESWILDCGEGVVLVDGGMTEQHVQNIENELSRIGRKWGDVKLILVTHKHGDHIKNLPRLVELTGAPVKSQKLEAPLIKEATGVDVGGLEDGEVVPVCGGIEVIHVPGHSEGNCSYYLRRHKAIIGGDTIFGDPEGNLTPPPERYCLDVEQATRGMRRLLDYDFDAFIYTHGKDIMKDAKRRIQELIDSC